MATGQRDVAAPLSVALDAPAGRAASPSGPATPAAERRAPAAYAPTTSAALADDWLTDALTSDGHRFAFEQAVRLLEQRFPGGLDPLRSLDAGAARIAFRAHEGLAFPAADVRGAEPVAGGEGLRLVLAFAGLYGVDAPLPAYVGAAATAQDDEARALRDFLDIFAHRLYALLYGSWKKYRPALAADEPTHGVHARRLLCVAGLGAPAPDAALGAAQLLPFAGLLRSAVRSAEGLRRLLRGLLPEVPLALEENVPRWVRIPERPRLGRHEAAPALLGDTALLGERLLDESGRFRLVLGPLTWRQLERLRPGGPDARLIAEAVRLYAPDLLDYDVELRVHVSELPVTRLGVASNRLGQTTWLGRPRREIEPEIVTYA